MYATFYIGGASPFIAVGALLGRSKAGAVVGFVAVSALLAVVTSLALFDAGMNQSTSETGRRIADCTTSWILLVLGVVAAFINTPYRRWFRFSLRTMFVLVAVFGCWLGYEMNWIRQRHAFAARQDVNLNTIHYDVRVRAWENVDIASAPWREASRVCRRFQLAHLDCDTTAWFPPIGPLE